jgi:hypothetical protein
MNFLVHADGSLPNVALMRLGGWLRAQGEEVRLLHRPEDFAPLVDARPERIFGSSIFAFSADKRRRFDDVLGPITWGGTGVRVASSLADVGVNDDAASLAYDLYPGFRASIGFLTRGCRLRCGFCVVPEKEGRPHAVASVRELWRGEPWPRHLHLLDNDAFSPTLREHWREAVREMRAGDFRVCFSQGINLRLVDEEAAAAIASIRYTGHDFDRKRLFTAWDSLGDESIFRRGIGRLATAGVPAKHLRVYMLVGYDARETWDSILYRFNELVALGCEPYPMVFDRDRGDLRAFQRWAVRHLYRSIPLPEYGAHGHEDRRINAEAREAIRAAWSRMGGWKPRPRMEVA